MTGSPASESTVKSGATSPSRTTSSPSRRAVGVVRVSRVGARSGEQFVSPSEQRTRIEEACARDGLELVQTVDELDVSGGASIDKRPGLTQALGLIEAGTASVLVVAYFDRLVRSLSIQREIVERVERAGGSILAVDVGEVRSDTASTWLSSTMLGMVAEYHRRVTSERTADAKRRAVERGVPPFPNIPPGYARDTDGALAVDSEKAPIVAEGFRLRADGATVREVREHLQRHGIERSYHGTQSMLTSRVYLGELRFGELVSIDQERAIVDSVTWQRVQRMSSPRGRRPKSDRLLARLDVLHCGTCGARMVIGSAHHGQYALYRCPPVGDCPKRVTISATIAESFVVGEVKKLLAGIHGTASVAEGLEDAESELASAERELDAAVRAFTSAGLADEGAATVRLTELRETRDQRRDRVETLRAAAGPALTVTAGEWDDLSRDGQRALIRAVVERVDVIPGRGDKRLRLHARAK